MWERFTPHTHQPRLLVTGQARRAIVVLQLGKPCSRQHRPPVLQVVIRPIPLTVPAFTVVAAWVGAEQYAAGFQGRVQLAQNLAKFLGRHMKQRSVGKDPVEAFSGQVELEKVLVPHFTAAVFTRHLGEAFGAVQADGHMTQAGEGLQVAPRPAAKIQNRERCRARDMAQQGIDVLAYIVVAGAFTEAFCALLIVAQSGGSNLFEGFCIEGHGKFSRRRGWPPTIPQRLFSARARRSPPS